MLFRSSQIVEDFNKSYHEENNPALSYVRQYDRDYFHERPVREVYDDYEDWCDGNAFNYSENMIRNTIIEIYEMKTKNVRINGVPTRCFVYNDEN